MSLAEFTRGMSDTLDTGIDLAREWDRQGDKRVQAKVGESIAAMQGYDPFALTDDASQQGIAEPGQTPQRNPNRGFDGHDFASVEREFWRNAGKISDPQAYAAATQAFGEMKMNKINQYLDQGIMAYDSGDTATAAKMLRGASAFTNPGTTPEVVIDPKTGAFVIANYDEKGNPQGGMALTRDQLMDFRGRNTDYNAWAARDQQDQQFQQQHALQQARFAASTRRANAAAASSNARTELLNDKTRAEIEKLSIEATTAQIANDRERLNLASDTARQPSADEAAILQNQLDAATRSTSLEAATQNRDLIIQEDRATREANVAAKQKQKATDTTDTIKSDVTRSDNVRQAKAESDAAADAAEAKPDDDFTAAVWAATEPMMTYDAKYFEHATPDTPPGGIPVDGTSSPSVNNAGGAEAVDPLAAGLIADTDDKGNTTYKDPLLFVQNTDGTVEANPTIRGEMDLAALDLKAHQPDMRPGTAAMIVEGMFGRSQSVKIAYPEDGDPYLRTVVGSVEVSPETILMLERYRSKMERELIKYGRLDEPEVDINTPQGLGASGTQAPNAMAASPLSSNQWVAPYGAGIPTAGGPGGMTAPPMPQTPPVPRGTEDTAVRMRPVAPPAPPAANNWNLPLGASGIPENPAW